MGIITKETRLKMVETRKKNGWFKDPEKTREKMLLADRKPCIRRIISKETRITI